MSYTWTALHYYQPIRITTEGTTLLNKQCDNLTLLVQWNWQYPTYFTVGPDWPSFSSQRKPQLWALKHCHENSVLGMHLLIKFLSMNGCLLLLSASLGDLVFTFKNACSLYMYYDPFSASMFVIYWILAIQQGIQKWGLIVKTFG